MLTYPYIGCDMSAPETLALPHGEAVIYSLSSPLKTTGNEDCAAVISIDDETTLLLVADGLGGHANGADASAFLTGFLGRAISKDAEKDTAIRETILKALEKTNLDLLRKETGEGTTVAITEITGNTIRTYHAGDSEILVTGQRGKVVLQTLSHSPLAYAVESGFIDEDQAVTHEDRHFISNFVGQADMHITIGTPVTMRTYDTLLLATDGLFDNLFRQEIIELIRKGPLPECAAKLSALVSDRMENRKADYPSKPDDVAFILYRGIEGRRE